VKKPNIKYPQKWNSNIPKNAAETGADSFLKHQDGDMTKALAFIILVTL